MTDTAIDAGSRLADTAAPLDALLVDAALGPVRRLTPDSSALALGASLLRQPRATSGRLASLAGELTRVAVGSSTLAPSKRDRRFVDQAWTTNPLLRRLVQGYLAAGLTAHELVSDAGLSWRDDQRVRFVTDNLLEALSPSNLPLINPESAKAVVDTAGLSLVRGGLNLARDMSSSPRLPEMVDRSAFEVGRNIAVTPGHVILRTEVFELIQYAPQTDEVLDIPLLIVPPTINKYYALDLAPGRSLVEHLVREGQQVFMLSWRNPDARHAGWDFDTYVHAILDALDAVRRVTSSERANLTGVCSGGILASIVAGYLAATGRLDQLGALVLLVTVIDNRRAGLPAALGDRQVVETAKSMSRRKGYLDGRSLAEVFAWMRPGDLVWNYWVNNYLLGKTPPAFDILYWNADTTRMTAGLHADFVDLAIDNQLTAPDTLTVLGASIDLSKVDLDAYIVAGIADHITPWQNCYRTTQLLGGRTRFVLSTSGHIAALVNPPDNPKASYQVNADDPGDASGWLDGAQTVSGSWWLDAAGWLADRSGDSHAAPAQPGGAGMRAIVPAPGTYVFDS